MNDYDFTMLNDKEFESFTVDLLSKVEGKRIERFKPGKDLGVDGRYFADGKTEVIIQCKHWPKSGIRKLIRHLASSELHKIKKLNPSRYILVTSLELSRQNKHIIKQKLSPFVVDETDILGKEDLNNILSEHPEIEQKHYKLWLSSTNVLKIILNNDIVGRSKYKIEEISENKAKYVITNNDDIAKHKLETLHSIIITGEPGIGKTTLAEQICLFYTIKGHEFCCIEESISDAEKVFEPGKKQIFYFDDFLGRNYLNALKRHEDSHIIQFIKRVYKDVTKRFILTSRSTILNQGKTLSDMYHIKNIDQNEYELKIDSLTNFEKAKILYNHIWFSELDEEYIDEIYKDKRYHKIIMHRNYNPRLIDFITDSIKMSAINPDRYWEYIEATLNNPRDIWSNVFDNQLDINTSKLTLLVAYNGQEINEESLIEAYLKYVNFDEQDNPNYGLIDFQKSAKSASGAVVKRIINVDNSSIGYDLFNPGISDFLIQRYAKDERELFKIFNSLTTIASIKSLSNLLNSQIMDVGILIKVISNLLILCLNDENANNNLEYKLKLISLSIRCVKLNSELIEKYANWLECINYSDIPHKCVYYLSTTLVFAIKKGIIKDIDIDIEPFIDSALDDDLDHEELEALSNLLGAIKNLDISIYKSTFKDNAIEYWKENIYQEIINRDVLENCIFDNGDAYGAVNERVYELLSEYIFDFDESEIDKICEYCDIDSIIKGYRSDVYSHEDYHSHSYSFYKENDAIDDLFDRTSLS